MRNSAFKAAVDRMEPIFDQLMACELKPITPRSWIPKRPGVYALFDDRGAVYVGRSKNLHRRVGNHTAGRPLQSSFAFKLAREQTGLATNYKTDRSKAYLSQDAAFMAAFRSRVEWIKQLSARYVIIEDDVEQHLFEVYAALALKTPYNEFKTS